MISLLYPVAIYLKDEVPATIMDNHMKNVEKASAGGKFNPNFGLANSGIAGTGNDKEEESEGKEGSGSTAAAGTDEEMKDLNKKDGKSVLGVVGIRNIQLHLIFNFMKTKKRFWKMIPFVVCCCTKFLFYVLYVVFVRNSQCFPSGTVFVFCFVFVFRPTTEPNRPNRKNSYQQHLNHKIIQK